MLRCMIFVFVEIRNYSDRYLPCTAAINGTSPDKLNRHFFAMPHPHSAYFLNLVSCELNSNQKYRVKSLKKVIYVNSCRFFSCILKMFFFCSSSLVLSINTRKYNSVFSFHLPHFHSMSEFFHLSKTQKITKIFISEINTTGFLFVVFQCAMRIVCLPHLRIHSTVLHI